MVSLGCSYLEARNWCKEGSWCKEGYMTCSATSYAPTAQVATREGQYLARLLDQPAKKEALEKKLAELRGESSGLPEGPEGKARRNAEKIESIVKQLNKASKIRPPITAIREAWHTWARIRLSPT
ncbi:NADH:ubiquinone oxidoreductase [Tulasnella sp. 424]|nr:NADH:ubiquinone oxidoreductase [Tulasnella sp. 424]